MLLIINHFRSKVMYTDHFTDILEQTYFPTYSGQSVIIDVCICGEINVLPNITDISHAPVVFQIKESSLQIIINPRIARESIIVSNYMHNAMAIIEDTVEQTMEGFIKQLQE